MKHRLILLLACLRLAPALHASGPVPSFVWQGRNIIVSQIERADETRVRLPDGTLIPLSAVPPLLRAGIAPPAPGTLLKNLRVLQILDEGLLMIPEPVRTQTFDAIFLRLDRAPDRKNGIQPEQVMTCYAVRDGSFTYIARGGAEKTVEAWKWVPTPPPVPPPALIPGSRLTGSALDRK
jgi:hypothetical protein